MMMWWWILIPGIVFLIVFLYLRDNPNYLAKHESPLDILDKRFASGELSREEYEAQRKLLLHKD